MDAKLYFIGKKVLLNVKNDTFVEDFTVHRKLNNINRTEFVRGDLFSDFNRRAFWY